MWLNPGWSLMNCECVCVCKSFSIVILIEFIHWMEKTIQLSSVHLPNIFGFIIIAIAIAIAIVNCDVVIAVLRWLFCFFNMYWLYTSLCVRVWSLIISFEWCDCGTKIPLRGIGSRIFARTSRVVLYSNIWKKVLLQITHTQAEWMTTTRKKYRFKSMKKKIDSREVLATEWTEKCR